MTYGSWKSAFNRNLMLGLNLLLRLGFGISRHRVPSL